MCGIAGLLRRGGVNDSHILSMTDALHHRGPDAHGIWTDADAGIGLGHRRLSIIDLSAAGAQPMRSRCGRYVLTYNGEIYNHQSLRGELDRQQPISWRGHSDTETLLEAIAAWGLAATLERCVGMFAIALWDRERRTLALARDRVGEKPLFYGWVGDGIAFGSELKAVRRAPGFANPVDRDVLALYLRFNYVPTPWSILSGIYKVEPGTILTLDMAAIANVPPDPPVAPMRTPGLVCEAFYRLDEVVAGGVDPALDTAAAAIDALEERLAEAVRLQSVADVPVGAFLSGGIDSTAIVALMRRSCGAGVKSFTIGFDQAGFDEAPYAKAVARHLGTDHRELYVSPDDARNVIPRLPTIYDEPFADSSQIPTVLVSELARREVTVVLSGDAGDELFGGYNRYQLARPMWQRIRAVPRPMRAAVGAALQVVPARFWDRVGEMAPGGRGAMLARKVGKVARLLDGPLDAQAIYLDACQEWGGAPPVRTARALRAPVECAGSEDGEAAERMMRWDFASYLRDDILAKVDRAAMATSLETRIPFLDHRVIEQAWRTPHRFKIKGGEGKWLLRQLVYRHVPRELIDRPKAGFAVPIGHWLRGPLRDWAEDLLSDRALAEEPAFDRALIRNRWAQHLRATHDWTGALWSVLMYQAWAREWNS